MAKFNLDEYETVDSRLKKFRADYVESRVLTYLVNDPNDPTRFVFRAEIYTNFEDTRPVATGWEEEITNNGSPVNRTSAMANAETSAIGRALANFIYSGNKRPSREEMEKVARADQTKAAPVTNEQLQLAHEALLQIPEIADINELRNFYTGAQEAGLLYIAVNGATVNSAITARKRELEASK